MLIKYKCDNKNLTASINIEKLNSGKNKISVEADNKNLFIPYKNWETNYDPKLIKEILNIKGPAYLCDEIMRDESPDYVQKSLKYNLLGYLTQQDFESQNFTQKRILDFGCGSGSSTVIMAKMFPNTKIIGIDLEADHLKIANLRAKYYGFNNLEFLLSPDGNSLPENLGKFDYIVLSAVFEHLLPSERANLLTKLWDLLNINGVIFINGTPYRYFPIETHTTGLPLINYLPNKFSCWYAKNFSKRNLKNDNWDTLLRKGIRGASIKEIIKILRTKNKKNNFKILEPCNLGLKDKVDLWYKETCTTKHKLIKKILFWCLKNLKLLTGITLVPYISVAIKKS
jgi:2-polyprenyl-3-methyl-5-hydroxy-6-metoxy-1,4-benzoquinol methylase